MSFNIRPMRAIDLAAVDSIQAQAYSGYFLESAEVIAQRFYASPATAWVAEREGKVCAYLVAYWSLIGKINPLNAPFAQVDDANCLYLHDLALLKSAQGLGVARALVQLATDYALQHSADAIALLSVQNSKKFWQGFGFSEFLNLDVQQQENLSSYVEEGLDGGAIYMLRSL